MKEWTNTTILVDVRDRLRKHCQANGRIMKVAISEIVTAFLKQKKEREIKCKKTVRRMK